MPTQQQQEQQQVDILPLHVAYMKPKLEAIIDAAEKNSVQPSELSEYPIIDISPYIHPNDYTERDRHRVVEKILEAATDTAGSFHITGHGIPEQLVEKMESEATEFYHQPIEYKTQYTKVPYRRGYTGMDTKSVMKFHGRSGVSLREMFAIEDPSDIEAPEPLRCFLEEYVQELKRVELLLRKILTLALEKAKGVKIPENALMELEGEEVHNFRSFFYPNNDDTQPFTEQDRLQAHTDSSAVTLLFCQKDGLEEIRNGVWTKVPPNTPSTLRCHLGDMMEFFSNGLFNSCVHRVNTNAESGDGDRLSYGYFRFEKPRVEGSGAIAPVCGVDERAKFMPISCSEYFMQASKAYFKKG